MLLGVGFAKHRFVESAVFTSQQWNREKMSMFRYNVSVTAGLRSGRTKEFT